MRPTSVPALSAFFAILLTGCTPTSIDLAKAQQTAQDFNLDARFGRNELVLDQISPAEREEYALHHRAWGVAIRLADVEVGGMKSRSDKDVDVIVHVSWYRPEQQELRSTTLQQQWHAKVEGWQLVGEKRVDGDIGLLGEVVVLQQPTEARVPAQFPTIRLSGSDPASD